MKKKLKIIWSYVKAIYSFIFSSRLFLTMTSFYFFILFYFINNKIILFNCSSLYNYIIYLVFGFIVSLIGLIAVKNKKHYDNQSNIEKIIPIEFSYISSYLGLFIISLSFSNVTQNKIEILIIIVIIYLIWFKLESVSFFNFYWVLLGYRFYEISTKNSNYILISKRKDVKNKTTINELKLKRINNYTFLEV